MTMRTKSGSDHFRKEKVSIKQACFTFDYQHRVTSLSCDADGNSVAGQPWWKNHLWGAHVFIHCVETVHNSRKLHLWEAPLSLNGSRPKAALLFPFFQPQLCQTWCYRPASFGFSQLRSWFQHAPVSFSNYPVSSFQHRGHCWLFFCFHAV